MIMLLGVGDSPGCGDALYWPITAITPGHVTYSPGLNKSETQPSDCGVPGDQWAVGEGPLRDQYVIQMWEFGESITLLSVSLY